MLTDMEKTKLKELGQRLKNARIERNDPQKEFAVRIGVSVPTLYKMEKGSPAINIGTWVKTLTILNKIDELDNLIAPQESLFDRYETMEKIKTRQRIKKRKNND